MLLLQTPQMSLSLCLSEGKLYPGLIRGVGWGQAQAPEGVVWLFLGPAGLLQQGEGPLVPVPPESRHRSQLSGPLGFTLAVGQKGASCQWHWEEGQNPIFSS